MFRKFFYLGIQKGQPGRNIFLLGAITLAGCNTIGAGIGLDPTLVDNITSLTRTICAFEPLAVTITNIVSVNAPGLTTATEIADAICMAVAPAKPSVSAKAAIILGANAPTIPRVAGVPIEGHFVR